MGMAAPVYYTADMVRALPDDGNRYETVHGELLVTPAPRPVHQYVIALLLERLVPYLARYRVGQLLTSPADISWGNPDVLVQPDIFVVRAKSFAAEPAGGPAAEVAPVEVPEAGATDTARVRERHVEERTGPQLDEADVVRRAVRAAGVTLMCAHNQLYLPTVARAREIVRQGDLGNVFAARATDDGPIYAQGAPDPTLVEQSVTYPNCKAAWAAGAAPLHVGQPGYRSGMDGDGDHIRTGSFLSARRC